ncbi:MAG: HlyD family type I secretion periplasmic adaptor subunit [Magnetococcales bacterium]|nr:HlyD family type I secretion periplasmic adaptor subunit [Magnetococcales bacterium]
MISALRRHRSIARAALQTEREGPVDDRRRHEVEFLPAVLEITDSPPSPVGRTTAYILIVLFLMVLSWSILGEVDIHATAQGKIIPIGRVKIIQPLEAGVVQKIWVKEGQTVHQDEPLVTLDPTDSTADEERLTREWNESRTEADRFRALGSGVANPVNEFHPPDDINESLINRHRGLLLRQWLEHTASLSALDGELTQQQARLNATRSEIIKLETVLPLIRERAQAKETLAKQGSAPRLEYLKLKQELVESEQDLRTKRHMAEETQAAMATLHLRKKQIAAQFAQTSWNQYVEADRKAESFRQELEKAHQRRIRSLLRAPEDGVVQQLKINTPGGVVTPAQELMWIVPTTGGVEVEAMVLNKDVGFVEQGQPAVVKVETFPFTKYGTLNGRVRHLSRDAVEEKQPLPGGQMPGLLYPARLTLDRSSLWIDGKEIPITPGMAATVEIATGNRRLIEYILSPILKIKQEGLRER